MKLTYAAYDKAGKESTGTIEATDATEAAEDLRRRGLFVSDITQADSGDALPVASPNRKIQSGRRVKNLAFFTRQLHVLLSTGTPIVDSLDSLQQQASQKAWGEVVGNVRTRVEEGASLSEALAAWPQYFDSVYCGLIAAGEAAGKLPTVLDRLAELIRKQSHMRSTISGALIYPSLLIVVAFVVLIVMLTFVLPRFTDMFEVLNAPLPPSTVLLLAISSILRSYWYLLILAAAGCVAAVVYYLRTPSGIRLKDTLVLRVFGLGRIMRSFATAKILRLLGILLGSHLPLLEVLRLVRDVTTNVHYTALMDKASEAVQHGEPISEAFAQSNLIHGTICHAVRSGERSGQLAPMMMNIADFLDEENEVVLRSLTSILEPVILIFLGLMVGFIAISMFLPLFDLTAISGAG